MGLHHMICPFCTLEADIILLENEVGIALLDAFPVTDACRRQRNGLVHFRCARSPHSADERGVREG